MCKWTLGVQGDVHEKNRAWIDGACCCHLPARCRRLFGTRTAEGKEQVITLKISHNMDFTTIPEAVVDAGTRLNEKYKAEGKNIRIEFEKEYIQNGGTP